MATTTIYPIPGYPAMYLTEDSAQMTIRPMVPEDQNDLLDFFRRISPKDRFDLKEDVTDPKIMERRATSTWPWVCAGTMRWRKSDAISMPWRSKS
jgi:hypothetical protein